MVERKDYTCAVGFSAVILRNLILLVSGRKWVERFVRNSRLTRKVVRRFIAGDTLAEAIKVSEDLVAKGFPVALDLLGENTTTPEEADAALNEYLQMLDAIHLSAYSGGWQPEKINIAIKLTQLGLDFDHEGCMRRVEQLLLKAKEYGNFVRLDMESSHYTDRTIECAILMNKKFGNVGTVLQSMLYRTPQDLELLIREYVRLRIVKGAYLEPKQLAYPKKTDTDEAYIKCMEKLLIDGRYPAIATHDKFIIESTLQFANANDIRPGRFEFQMLYGICRQMQSDLKKQGYTVRVYVPYGKSWYPYFTRRLAERPANLLFFIRSLFSK